MFVGHYCAAILTKALSPRIPFWLLIVAAQFVDILWAIFIVTGVEQVRIDPSLLSNPLDLFYMPYTHSLLAAAFWALIAYGLVRTSSKFNLSHRECFFIALVVVSHWFFDLVVHRPDLQLVEGTKVGLGLWNYPLIALALELGLVVASISYLIMKQSGSGMLKSYLVSFAALLVLIQLSSFLILPETVNELSIMTLSTYLGLPFIGLVIESKSRN